MAVPKCANAHDAYLECTNYALTKLSAPNVAMYLDAGKLAACAQCGRCVGRLAEYIIQDMLDGWAGLRTLAQQPNCMHPCTRTRVLLLLCVVL
jgi:hypothetical protein